jgi:hypothetical protein
MSLIEIADKNQLKQIQSKIRKDCTEFNQLSVGSKVKAADQLYTENRILKELGVAAVETIERMDEEIEIKDNKINILEKELKDVNNYDEEKIQALLNKKPVIRTNHKERAKRRLMNTLSISYK